MAPTQIVATNLWLHLMIRKAGSRSSKTVKCSMFKMNMEAMKRHNAVADPGFPAGGGRAPVRGSVDL